MAETIVTDGGTQIVAVYGGPRGIQGATGATGAAGSDGSSISVKGDWNSGTTYTPGDAVSSRSLYNPGIKSLWIVKDGQTPTVGIAPHLEPSKWVEVAGGDLSQQFLGTTLPVYQLTHSFTSVGQPVSFNVSTGRYELADARYDGRLCIGVVADVTDANNFLLQFSGRIMDVDPVLISDASSWTLGAVYYLSTSMGFYQESDPSVDGWRAQPAVMPIDIDGVTGFADLLILSFGVDSLTPKALHQNQSYPIPRREGDLWFRHDDYPGLYVSVENAVGSLKWVQANG